MASPRPAATVMLLRDLDAESGFEVYMARRSARSKFSPDAYVFPGGTVDETDRSPAALARLRGAPHGVEAPFALAALRELFEEAGILIACDARGEAVAFSPDRLGALRARLAGGAPLAAVLERENLWLDARGLHHYSNWVTPASEPLRFDTHFFAARAPHDQVAAADAFELHDGRWLEPHAALAGAERGELTLVYPTLRHLERLAAFERVDAVLAHARGRRIVSIQPFITEAGAIELPAEIAEW